MDKIEFAEIYAPYHQYEYSLAERRCHIGTAPTLRVSCQQYGSQFVSEWLQKVIVDLQDFTGAARKLTATQIASLSYVILTQFGTLKVTEILLFAVKAKSGQFGKFYNTIDPLDITTALVKWQGECDKVKGEYFYEQARKKQETETEFRETITADDAIRMGIITNPLLKRIFTKGHIERGCHKAFEK